jgi:hypothetical protein
VTTEHYLTKILQQQTLADDSSEMKELLRRREEIQGVLNAAFAKSRPSIRWGGSKAKGTMIRESYDGDMTCYFARDDQQVGDTLQDIYDSGAAALEKDFEVQRKNSALRVKDRSTKSTQGFARDLHIDVVPGRFFEDEKSGDVWLHQNEGKKERLKTNLETHIAHIRDSEVTDAVRLMKLWNVRNGIGAKTFVLELLVVKVLSGRKRSGLAEQLEHIWTEFRDRPNELAVEDPANPHGNDLKPALDQVRAMLSAVAKVTLQTIATSGWEVVFGPLEDSDGEAKKVALVAAAARVTHPTRPWLAS